MLRDVKGEEQVNDLELYRIVNDLGHTSLTSRTFVGAIGPLQRCAPEASGAEYGARRYPGDARDGFHPRLFASRSKSRQVYSWTQYSKWDVMRSIAGIYEAKKRGEG